MSIESRTRLAREASIMKSLDHPLMADLFYFMEDEFNSYLVMEYLENSSLLDLINGTFEEYEYDEEEEENNNGKEDNLENNNKNDSIYNEISNNINNNNNNDHSKNCKRSKRISKINLLDEDIIRKIFVQLIVALEFLHNVQHVAHRDIKAENVLLDRYNNIRIIDFGLSAIVQDENKSLKRTVGSIAYTAPEILMKKPYSKSADIWSTGVLLYALSTSRLPFISKKNSKIISSSKNASNSSNAKNTRKIPTNSGSDINLLSRSQNLSSFYDVYNDPKKMCQLILHGKLQIPESLSPELQDLLKRMLEKDPQKRITIKEIENHPFFSQKQYNKLIDFVKRQDKVEDIDLELDPEIVAKMEARGMNCEMLPQLLFVQEIDEVSAAYKEMKKVKVMKNLSKLYAELEDESFKNHDLCSNQDENQVKTQNDNNHEKQTSPKNELQTEFDVKQESDESSSQTSTSHFFFGSNLYKIIHDDNYEDSSEGNIERDISENTYDQHSFKKSQSVVISELNLNVLLNSSETPSVQTSPPLNDNIRKLNNKLFPCPHPTTAPTTPTTQSQQLIHSQMMRSQTSSLIFTPNEFSDGTNTKIVPKSYIRPRIHLGLMKV